MIDLREVSPADTGCFAAWHAALSAGSLAGRPAATVSSLQELTDSLAAPSPVKRRIAVAAVDDDECVGALLLELPLQSDLRTAILGIWVPPAHRGRGVGTALWRWAEDRARTEGRTILQCEVHVPHGHTLATWPGARFATAHGFTSRNVEDHLVLDLPVDPARLAALDARPGGSQGHHVVAWTGPCPETYVDAWADLMTAMSRDAPAGAVTRDAVAYTVDRVRLQEQRMADGWITLSSLAFSDLGDPVGYSTLLVPRTQPEHVYQDDTLVLHAHRGHGLGALLKLANLRSLSALPERDVAQRHWLHTYTQQENLAMQRVNATFGFRPVEAMHEFERHTA